MLPPTVAFSDSKYSTLTRPKHSQGATNKTQAPRSYCLAAPTWTSNHHGLRWQDTQDQKRREAVGRRSSVLGMTSKHLTAKAWRATEALGTYLHCSIPIRRAILGAATGAFFRGGGV